MVTGATWYALDTPKGLFTNKSGIEEELRGKLHGYGDHLFYDNDNTPFYDEDGNEAELISLGDAIVSRYDGELKVTY